jgi:hypothetical protein
MGQNGNKPKLDIGLNESATVRLLRDKPMVGTSAFGEYHLFAVEHDGVEKSFFAPAELANQISTLELGAGDTITIQKLPYQVGKKVVSRLVLVVPTQDEKKKEPTPADDLKAMLLLSIRDASEIVKEAGMQFSNEEIQKLATTLFIQRTRLA